LKVSETGGDSDRIMKNFSNGQALPLGAGGSGRFMIPSLSLRVLTPVSFRLFGLRRLYQVGDGKT